MKLMLISLIARHCSRKSFATLANKISWGGGAEISARTCRTGAICQGAYFRLVACLSIAFAVLATPVAFAVTPSQVYEDEMNGATIRSDNIPSCPSWFLTGAFNGSRIVLSGHPTGLTVSSASQGGGTGNARCYFNATFSFTGNITSDTTVTMFVMRGSPFVSGPGPGGNIAMGSFTIKPTVKEIRTSTPTNSSAVTEAGSTSTFTVRLGEAPSGNVTVAVSLSDTTEASISPNSLSFTSTNYNTAQTVTVTGKDDSIFDGTQSYNVVLNPSSSADSDYNGLSNVNVAMTTTDNESAPSFSIDSPSIVEGDSGSETLTFTVSMSPGSASQHTVNYAQTGGTATSGTDYTAVTANTLTFAAGTTSRTITVSVTGDTEDEGGETVVITLSSASSGTSITTAVGTGTIGDNDPSFSIDSPSVREGDSTSVNLTFTVTMTASSTSTYTVNYAQTGGTATSGTDYTAVTAGMLTFAVGETSKTITVSVTGDTTQESHETVEITLSNASSGARIATASGTGTITDNDSPGFSIDSPSVAEGDSSTTSLTFTVSVSPALTASAMVSYAQTGGTATSGTDYTAVNAGMLTFAVGETSKTITVSVTGDTVAEPDETVVITLSNESTGTNIVTATGTGRITNDDTGLSIADTSVTEGDSDSVDLTFTVTLSPAATTQVTVDYADAGSGTATSGTDYTAVTAGMLMFEAGITSQTITVSVTGDMLEETDETVVIMLSNASSGAGIVKASGTGTIMDNDRPGFSIDSPSVIEGDEGESTTLTFTVTLEPAAMTQVTVNYADAGTGTAESGVDYTAINSGILTFAAGETSKTINVSVIGDTLSESNETVVVALSSPNPSSYILVVASGRGTIRDNEGAVLNEVDTEIVAEVALEVTTSVLTAIGDRIASVVGGAATVAPPVGGFADGGLPSILERAAQHSRERDRGLERSEMPPYRSLDGAGFVYSPNAASLGANGSADESGGGLSGSPTVWGSIDYRKLSGRGADALRWDGELASVNIGTDMMSDSGVLFGLAVGVSKGSFGYQGSTSGSGGAVKMRVNTLNPYVGWTLSELASLWAAVGYGKGKVNYNDDDIGEASSKMTLTSAALGGRYRLSSDGSADGRLIQVDLKGEAWGLETKVKGNQRRPTGSKSRAHGVRIAIERHRNGVLESGALLVLSGEAGVRWDGGDGDTGTGFEIGGSADYSDSATGMKVIGTARALVEHESDRKNWGASLTAGSNLSGQDTGLTYRSSLSHGQAESGVDSLWDSSAVSRVSSEENSLATRLEAEVGYRLYGMSGLHTPYVGFGVEDSNRRDYRIGMRYAGGSAVSSGLEFERREASGKLPDHRVMLTGQMNW